MNTLRRLSFRAKLLLSMMLVVASVSSILLLITQRHVQASYEAMFREQFDRQLAYFTSLQEARLQTVRAQCLKLSQSVRIEAAMVQSPIDVQRLYQDAEAELREVLGDSPTTSRERPPPPERRLRATFARFVDAECKPLEPPDGRGMMAFSPALRQQLGQTSPFLRNALASDELQQIAYVAMGMEGLPGGERLGPLRGRNRAADRLEPADRPILQEVVFTRVLSREDGSTLGGLALGFTLPELVPSPRRRAGSESPTTNAAAMLKVGVLLEQRLFANTNSIPEDLADTVTEALTNRIQAVTRERGDFTLWHQGVPFRIGYELMNPQSTFPPAWQVSLYSLADAEREKQKLRALIYVAGGAGLGLALVLSLTISHGLATPLLQLVRGTETVAAGNYEVQVPVQTQDEVGHLTRSFNQMVQGLALKEKYRTVLNMVADERVAQRLVSGEITLGGELREISVLFCDIRGFTALTQNMPPGEVIGMLNEHMTALNAIVKQHHGLLDKFVGDLLMAIFGAPLAHGNDTGNAAQCALNLIRERNRLNAISRHKIEVGIGVATGTVVAGCMGSADRLNYTVLGDRVNLASRLCSKAGPGEVLIDDNTLAKLGAMAKVEPKGELQLKGIAAGVPAYRLLEVTA